MADEQAREEVDQDESTSVAALAAKKALSHRDSNSGNGSTASGGESGSVLNSVLSGGWDAARAMR
jgi:hypothetical protein